MAGVAEEIGGRSPLVLEETVSGRKGINSSRLQLAAK